METNSFFYTKPIINDYYDKIKDVINDKILFNQDDIIDYITTGGEIRKEQATQFIQQSIMRSDICQGSIDQEYIVKVLEKIYSTNFAVRSECDICFILTGPLDSTKTIEEKFAQVVGFCIVKRGDCPKYGKTYTLNLVCSKREHNVGSIFIGLYLYTILMHPLDTRESLIPIKIVKPIGDFVVPVSHIGLLELSGGYKNTSGLCLYSKFGFKIDISLSGRGSNCFVNMDNLAMINNYIEDASISIEERKTKILNIVKRLDAGFEKHVICNVKPGSEEQRRLVETYYNIKNKTNDLNALVSQSKFAINKMADGNLKAEFQQKLDDKKKELSELDQIVESIVKLSIKGGKSVSVKKNKRRTRKKNNKRKNKSKRYQV